MLIVTVTSQKSLETGQYEGATMAENRKHAIHWMLSNSKHSSYYIVGLGP